MDDLDRLYKLTYITGKSTLEFFYIAGEHYGFMYPVIQKDFKRYLKECWREDYKLPQYVKDFLDSGRCEIDKAPWTWLQQPYNS